MTELLCIFLRPALLFVSNPKRYFFLFPIALLAWVLDVVLCHTFWAAAFGWPKNGAMTISDTLEYLCSDWGNADVHLFRAIAKKINRICPTHDHIKGVL